MQRRDGLRLAAAALLAISFAACGGGGGGAGPGPIDDTPPWGAIYWVNSNSGPIFNWSLDGVQAKSYLAIPLNGTPSGSACQPFGGAVRPGVAAQSMYSALAPGASFAIWMQPRDHEFDGVTLDQLAAAVQQELEEFQSCVEQDWPNAPTASGFLCVKEQQLGGDANCDTLAAVFAQGVQIPGVSGNVSYGILAAPGSMNRTDVDAALGEMYEPVYFPPSNTCPAPSDGATYGGEIGRWIAGADVIPPTGSVAVPSFGGPSSTCPLDYDQVAPAAAALADKVPKGLIGLGLWG